MYTFDKRTVDSAGAFMVGELERLDKTLHAPLTSVTWNRDIDLRSDVTIADEASSFTNSSFGAAGGVNPGGKNWVGKNSTQIAGIALDIDKTAQPLRLWAMELGFSIPELAAAEQLGRPIDAQKYEGLRLKHNMDTDEMVYVGDSLVGATGLCNHAGITPEGVTTTWATATGDQILDDVNGLVEETWKAAGYAVCPTHLLLAPRKFALLSRPITAAGSMSIMEYISTQCISNAINGQPLKIHPVKWLTGRGAGGVDRAVAYTKGEQFVRFPMVPLQRTPVENRSLYQITTYFGRLGELEFVYPETVGYADGM